MMLPKRLHKQALPSKFLLLLLPWKRDTHYLQFGMVGLHKLLEPLPVTIKFPIMEMLVLVLFLCSEQLQVQSILSLLSWEPRLVQKVL